MAEHTKGQNLEDRNEQRSKENERLSNTERQPVSTDKNRSTQLDEKSSGSGRRNKDSGIATKDGLTGSDYDGQVTDR